jgi:hypothetical protein
LGAKLTEKVKLRAGDVYVPVTLTEEKGRYILNFGYNKTLLTEIKTVFEGRKWHGYDDVNPRKVWSIPITPRNLFQLEHLKGKYGNDPFGWFDRDYLNKVPAIVEYCKTRPYTKNDETSPYKHQLDSVAHGLTVRNFIWAEEMGLGKTLAAFILMEMSGVTDWWWIGSVSALREVESQAKFWKLKITPRFMTYDRLKEVIRTWPDGMKAPQGVIFDEIHNVKTPTAQRSVAAKHLADSMRRDWDKPFIGGMSGSPAPKSPDDWWHICEVICPGFLREGSKKDFKERLALIESRQNEVTGGAYPHLVTWLDDENKCKFCGKLSSDQCHKLDDFAVATGAGNNHAFAKSVNEVANLHNRLKGLVLTKFKKDCLDLPDKVFTKIYCEPTEGILNAARLIISTAPRAIEALTRLRELSDGFQYKDVATGKMECPLCKGSKEVWDYFDESGEYVDQEKAHVGLRAFYSLDQEGFEQVNWVEHKFDKRKVECMNCSGSGEVDSYSRTIIEIDCPKDELLKQQLELHEDVGRLVVYAGFQASVDRVVKIGLKEGWTVIAADGRGWRGHTAMGKQLDNNDLLSIFQYGQDIHPKTLFVGAAGAAGEGLNLTASPTIVFWSNGFNGKDRMQATDRGHRPGMDVERGGRIIDFIHLDSDEYVLDNLNKKKSLQNLSLQGLKDACFK